MNSDRKHIVFDTSTLISAFINSHSLPSQIVQLASNDHKVYLSQETFRELKEVIFRPKFDRYFLQEDLRKEFLYAFSKRAIFAEVTLTVNDCKDPKDNKFLALARTINAHYLVSSDLNDLIPLHPYYGTAIVTPNQFLEIIK